MEIRQSYDYGISSTAKTTSLYWHRAKDQFILHSPWRWKWPEGPDRSNQYFAVVRSPYPHNRIQWEYNGLRGENRGPFKGQQASASNPVMQYLGCGWASTPLVLTSFSQNILVSAPEMETVMGFVMCFSLWKIVQFSGDYDCWILIVIYV